MIDNENEIQILHESFARKIKFEIIELKKKKRQIRIKKWKNSLNN
jgi:hypothetical protein